MSAARIDHRRVRGAGIELHVATLGDGTPVALLHGFPVRHAPRLTIHRIATASHRVRNEGTQG